MLSRAKRGRASAPGARLLLWVLLLAPCAGGAAELRQGFLDWTRRVELGTPVSGVVVRVACEIGDRVEVGQTLLELDPRPFELALALASARLARAEPELEDQRIRHEQAQELHQRAALSDGELRRARVEVERAEAEVAHARAELQRAELERDYAVLRAPFTGVVVHRAAEPGQVVVSRLTAPALLVLAGAEGLDLRVALPAADLAALQPGTELQVQVGGQRLRGTLRSIAPEPEISDGRVYEVRVSLPGALATGLRVGQSGELELP